MSENQKEPQYKLRWSEELRNKVVESSKKNSRSINAEICTRLEESFTPSLEKETMHIALSGFCAGLHFRYQTHIEELQKELSKETDSIRIELLKSEIQRIEILSTEMKAISERMSQKL